jgi:hypothetical protein
MLKKIIPNGRPPKGDVYVTANPRAYLKAVYIFSPKKLALATLSLM